MTLVIVSHDLRPGLNSVWNEKAGKDKKTPLEPDGLLVATDTAITTSDTGVTLLSGFRKSYEVPIKVWKPYFVGAYFHSYQTTYLETSCFIAFAGSTLTAQHVLNSITEHLGKLRISYRRSSSSPGEYCVIRHCQKNDLEQGQSVNQWGDDMFLSQDIEALLTADVIADNILYSINESLSSARRYKLDAKSLQQMQTDFAAGVYCPVSRQHRLYTFRMDKALSDNGIYEVFAKKEQINWNQVAVLGMREEHEADAQAVLDNCIKSCTPPGDAIFDFLNSAIDKAQKSGSNAIDRPSVLKRFESGRLEKVRHSSGL